MEVALSVIQEYDRFAVDHRLVRAEAANRIGDPGEATREVGAASAPDRDALALLPGDGAEAVMLDFVQPTRTGGAGDPRAWVRTGG